MKKFTIALLCVIMSVSVTGCGTSALKSSVSDMTSSEENAVESATADSSAAINYKNTVIWDDITGDAGQILVSVKYPHIEIGDYADGEFVRSEKYGNLANAIDKYNSDIKTGTLSAADGYADIARDDLAENHSASSDADEYGGYDAADMEDTYYANEVTASVTRSDSVAFSILNTNYSFVGGPHPYTGYTTYNYDSETGKQLYLGDILKDPDSFPALFIDELEKQYSYFSDSYLLDDPEAEVRKMLDSKDTETTLQWTFDPYGITVFISPYELAAYAAGPAFVHLSYSDHPGLIEEKYEGYPENYGISVASDEKITLLCDDGTVKDFTVSMMPDPEYNYGYYLSIQAGKSTYQDSDDLYYDFDLYIVRNQGKYYLYADGLTDNDWHVLTVYDLNGTEITKKVADDALYGNAPSNPADFTAMNRTDLLSTYSVMHRCHVGNDGLPVSDDDMYTAFLNEDTEFTLTTLKDVNAEIMKPGEADFSEGTIRKGTKLVPYRTDMVDTVILKDSKDNMYKVRITHNDGEWAQLVDGSNIEQLFDGIRFAG